MGAAPVLTLRHDQNTIEVTHSSGASSVEVLVSSADDYTLVPTTGHCSCVKIDANTCSVSTVTTITEDDIQVTVVLLDSSHEVVQSTNVFFEGNVSSYIKTH